MAAERRIDAALAGGVALALALVVSAGQAGAANAGAYLWAAALGALMFGRRRYPRSVLALTVAGMFAYYSVGHPAIGVALPVAAALFSAAEAGHRRSAVTAAAVVLTVSTAFRLLEGQDVRYVLLYETVGHLALIAAAIALGELTRARRRIAALTERQVELAAERRLDEHKQALSRELHDSIGHTMTVAAIHTNVARQEAARNPAAAAAALDSVAASVSAALDSLRTAVRELQSAPPPLGPAADPAAPVEAARAAGYEVSARMERVSDPALAAMAHRVVREAVTNTMRHAKAGSLDVEVRHTAGELVVRVTDDGTGLSTLHDEVTARGGRFEAGPSPSGWRVSAALPLPDSTSSPRADSATPPPGRR